MTTQTAASFTVKIWIAGDYDTARGTVRRYCSEVGDCYALQEVDFIYTGGEESGLCVTRINYPRFPDESGEILRRASDLAGLLLIDLNQKSYSVETPEETIWFSKEPTP